MEKYSDRSFRDQMYADVMVITSMSPLNSTQYKGTSDALKEDCAKTNVSMNKTTAQNCLTKINGAIIAIDEYRSQSQQPGYSQGSQGSQRAMDD